MTNTQPSTSMVSTTAFPGLLTRYIVGQIDDDPWSELMQVFDGNETTTHERTALATFVQDALDEIGAEGFKWPRMQEVNDLFQVVRLA